MIGTTASLVESIAFTRRPGCCEHCDQHDYYTISWMEPDGTRITNSIYWCPHPLCDDTPFRWPSPAYALLTEWISNVGYAHIAVAYLLVLNPPGKQPHVEARIGICSQWEDPVRGNVGDGHRLFTQRYFAESGPGVYPATIQVA